MTKREKTAIISSIIYIGIMAVAMFVIKNVSKSDYESTDMVNTLIYFEVVMTLFSIFVYKKYFSGSSFNKIEKMPFGSISAGLFTVILLALVGMGVLQFTTAVYAGKDMKLLIMIIVTTLFVGVSEELMFRGILLPALVEKRGKKLAVIISSVVFGLLHFVNILGGLPTKDMLNQMMLTYLVGIVFAFVFIKTNNLLLLMIYHSFWDMLLIVSSYVPSSLAALAMLAQNIVILTFALYIMVDHLYKKSKKAK